MVYPKNWGAAALFLLISCAGSAFAMAGEYGKGDPKHPTGNSTWATGTDVLANRSDRIGGHWVNALDTFYYAGNAKDFNSFLQQYAKVQGTRILYLHTGSDKDVLAPQDFQGTRIDWQMNAGHGNTYATLYLSRQVALRDVSVPPGVRIEVWGAKTKEVTAFLARQQTLLNPKASRGNAPKQAMPPK